MDEDKLLLEVSRKIASTVMRSMEKSDLIKTSIDALSFILSCHMTSLENMLRFMTEENEDCCNDMLKMMGAIQAAINDSGIFLNDKDTFLRSNH